MAVLEAEIANLTMEIWSTVLGQPSTRIDGAPLVRSENFVTACIHFTGDWEGALAFDCDRQTARRLAARMFELDDAELENEDVTDAMGELANMLAGNLKPFLGGSPKLSLPTVVEGRDYLVNVQHSESVTELQFQAGNDRFWITLMHKNNNGRRSTKTFSRKNQTNVLSEGFNAF